MSDRRKIWRIYVLTYWDLYCPGEIIKVVNEDPGEELTRKMANIKLRRYCFSKASNIPFSYKSSFK